MRWHLKSGIKSLLASANAKLAQRPDHAAPSQPEVCPIPSVPLCRDTPTWIEQAAATDRKKLPPDPKVMRAIGLNHTFESAVADIVDNSFDAGASNILVRFIRHADRLVGLCIVDDGKGMDEATIDRAMTVGGQRTYGEGDLGHFGMGLKAASLGQARVLTVVSRARGGCALGRRWLIENAAETFDCELLHEQFNEATLARQWRSLTPATGTVVMWTEVKCFPQIADAATVDQFLDEMVTKVRQHLGLVFHRLLAQNTVAIAVDVEDAASGETGLPFAVEPLNPFGYVRSGRPDYPRRLSANGHDLALQCHIWPGRSNHSSFRLLGPRPEPYQGFFFYRNNRLLQPGGWSGATHNHRRLQLARVEIDVPSRHADFFSMNAEKTRVEPSPLFHEIIRSATDGQVTFSEYLEHARSTYRESQKRRRERPKVLRPGKGFGERVRNAIGEEYEFLPGDKPLSIRWADLGDDTFFDIDRDECLIRLNKKYRSTIATDASLNDAPVVKALVYLLAQESFHGAFLGTRARDNVLVWQSILTAAARAEIK